MRIEIQGQPFAKQRPRFSRIGGRVYTPAPTVAFEKKVADMAKKANAPCLEGPVKLIVIAVFEPAKSWSKKKRAAHLWNPHLQKPDLDNVAKGILDGLNGIAFTDDSQVYEIECRKMWGEPAMTIVEVIGKGEACLA